MMLSVRIAQCELESKLAASQDNQIIEVTGYEYIKGLSTANNVTLIGIGNATIDGSNLESVPATGE